MESIFAHWKGRTMGYETINVTPATPRIGAEVEGLSLAKLLSNRQVEELHQALAEHQVLFFRDQPLDVESHTNRTPGIRS
jgi:taurine dioxygenase